MKKAFTLIELMIVIAIIAIIAAIAIPNLLEARKYANETSAVGSLRTLVSSQALYVERSPAQAYASALTELQAAGLVDNVLGAGAKQGYFVVINNSNDAYTWDATANPAVPGDTGDRYFFTDQSGVIRFSTAGSATAADNAVGGK